jgi:nicotinate-nucleotide--dimethylbenzimidazole phosphoribosyltransferase
MDARTRALEELLADTIARIHPPDEQIRTAAARALDAKTKPRGSLGRLETLAAQVAAVRRDPHPGPLSAAVVIAAADHGVTDEGVSAYPSEVTRQMVANFATGGAAISVLARLRGTRLVLVDAGVAEAVALPGVHAVRIGAGTRNFLHEPAMTRAQALEALTAGIELAAELAAEGAGLLVLGEMGIGNTTTASALCAALLPAEPERVCGRGTGIDDQRLAHKVAVVRAALARHAPAPDDPLGTLAALGGFELALLAGVALGAAERRLVILLDGFVVGAAALVAARLAPASVGSMVAGHRSPEPGHRLVLDELGLEPLLELGMRLGEGSGALVALPLVDAALALLREMATFGAAGVTDTGA